MNRLRSPLSGGWHRIVFHLLILLTICSTPAFAKTEIENGQLVNPDWDYTQNQPLKLVGEWEVIWGKLVAPQDFDKEYKGALFHIPGRWNKVDHPRMNGAYGVATFRAKLDLPDYGKELSFHQISPHSAWKLYANGIPIGANGIVSDQPGRHRSHYTSRIFPAYPGKSELVLQISNFSHAFGGPGHPPTIWDSQQLFRTLGFLSLYYVLVLGVLLAIGIFHLIFYLADRNHREQGPVHLWFSLLCFIMVFRISGVIPYFHIYFAESSYWSDLRFPYASLFAAPAVYVLFFRSVFPGFFPERTTLAIIGLNLLLTAMVLLTPEGFFTHFRDFSIGMNIFVILFSIVFTAKAMLGKQPGAAIILISNMIFLVTAINDAVIYTDNGTGFDLTPFGILILGMGYSYALLLRLQTTFKNARDTSVALEKLNLDLEQQVRDRTRAFKSAAAKAENSAHDQAQFIAAASHDLRQPLHALAMFNSALRNKIGNSAATKLLEKQNESIRNMGDLLQDTLDSARAETTQKSPVWASVELDALVSSVSGGFEIQAEKRGLQYVQNIGPGQIVTDGAMLQRILSNLLENALKAAKGKIEILARRQSSKWIIEICDDGNGIAKGDIDRIFESYISLEDHKNGEHGGYGLGLYVVKNFTKLLGGTVTVESTLGEGTRFILEFPVAQAKYQFAGEEGKSTKTAIPLPGMKILAVDDETSVLEAMKAMLETWGCQIAIAEDGAQAENAMRNGFAPDLAIVDYHLFGSNGLEVIDKLREHVPDLSAVVLTGATEPEILAEIEAYGLPCLSKPIDTRKLGRFLHDRQMARRDD
ncbi:ATP-binding protein [Parasphingorhabdus sp.]|uniref:hybrid sensor histidine kinase/response regulator n=1 Tax=Parasphingorhabdus sp. TaxID=2709688 RepID=UPI003A91A944